ncbi:hypothetical protein TNIN_485461 [Trichonephila inaurata madagascariensis]|uniref:Uncharacterized protein n=1 Tax=Trichonephila inaurata madagascariensis TaxID=2747483 RepID=A0A8X6X957_9ARAC|nr:hypothetical protein TNIN_485461 [Trichonephila inaurata madagascariensis]
MLRRVVVAVLSCWVSKPKVGSTPGQSFLHFSIVKGPEQKNGAEGSRFRAVSQWLSVQTRSGHPRAVFFHFSIVWEPEQKNGC